MAVQAIARHKIPKTRYPNSAERFYARQLVNLVNQLGKVLLQVFDEQIKPQIKLYNQRQDAAGYRQDAPLDIIRQAIEIVKGLSLGIFATSDIQRIADRFVKSVNQQSKANAQAQGKTHNVDPTTYEPWLNEFMRSSVAENVSYISTIRDEFFPKIESIIYQGVKKGQSLGDIRQGLADRIGMTRNRAQFIAVDQTGTIFGQMTAKRHQEMGVSKFEWVDAGDNRVRPLHQHYNGHVYEYAHPPADGLPGEPFRCRCVAYPVFDDKQVKRQTSRQPDRPFKAFNNEKEVELFLNTNRFVKSLTDDEKKAIGDYSISAFRPINSYMRSGEIPYNLEKVKGTISQLKSAISKSPISDNIKVWRKVRNLDFITDVKPGKRFADLGFISTTPLPKTSSFIGSLKKEDRLIEINVPKDIHGAYIAPLSTFEEERELLLENGLAFEITRVEKNKIYCKVVGKVDENGKMKSDSATAKAVRKEAEKNRKLDRSDRFTWKKGDVIELN